MLNKAVLCGRLVKDPELAMTPSGTPITKFTLAINRKSKKDETDFLNIITFNKTAEFVGKYFTKGQMAIVVGSIQTRSWEGTDGQKRYATEIVADEVNFCGPKNEETQQFSKPKADFVPVEVSGDLPF